MVGLGNPGAEYAGTRHNAGAEVATVLADRHQGRLKSEKGLRSLAGEIRIGGHRVLVAVPLTFMNDSGLAVAPLVRRAGIEHVDGPVPGGAPPPASATTGPATTGPATPASATPASATTGPATSASATTASASTGLATTGPATTVPPAKARPATHAGTAWRLIVVHDELDIPSGRIKVKVGGGTAGNNGLKSIHSHLHTGEYLRVRVGIGKPPGRQSGADYVLRRPGASERAALAQAIEDAADAVEVIVTEGVEAAMNRFNGSGG